MAHFSGLVAGGAYPNPTQYADPKNPRCYRCDVKPHTEWGRKKDNWVLLWSLKMLNSKLVISLSKSAFLAVKTIIFLIDLGSRDLDENVKMSVQSNAHISLIIEEW